MNDFWMHFLQNTLDFTMSDIKLRAARKKNTLEIIVSYSAMTEERKVSNPLHGFCLILSIRIRTRPLTYVTSFQQLPRLPAEGVNRIEYFIVPLWGNCSVAVHNLWPYYILPVISLYYRWKTNWFDLRRRRWVVKATWFRSDVGVFSLSAVLKSRRFNRGSE